MYATTIAMDAEELTARVRIDILMAPIKEELYEKKKSMFEI